MATTNIVAKLCSIKKHKKIINLNYCWERERESIMDWSIPNWIGMDRIGPKCTKYFYYILIPGQMMWGKYSEKKWWTRFLNMLWVLLSICSSVMAKKGMFEIKSKCIFFETLFVGIVTPSWIKFILSFKSYILFHCIWDVLFLA